MKRHLPNSITLLNLLFGCIAIVALFLGLLKWAIFFISLSLIADFLDGFVARLLGVSSPLGKELDSLADMVSFGFFPGVLAYQLLQDVLDVEFVFPSWALMGFVVTVFSGLRLGMFNLDTRQTEDFIGLNTPANTIFFLGLTVLFEQSTMVLSFFDRNEWLLFLIVLLFSFLLVSPIRFFSLKMKDLSLSNNAYRYGLLLGAILLALIAREWFLVGIIIWYLVLGFAYHLLTQKQYQP